MQEMITDELAGMAAGMKSNTLAMESRLRQRAVLLDGTETALEQSLQNAKKSKTRAKEIHTRCDGQAVCLALQFADGAVRIDVNHTSSGGCRNRVGFCKTCLALLLVGC